MSVVFITGGARRIGRTLAERFASDGWSVGVTYHTSQEAKTELEERFRTSGIVSAFSRCDVSKERELQASLEELKSVLGVPDVVVSNAGVFPDAKPLAQTEQQDVLDAIAINTLPLLTIARWLQAQNAERLDTKHVKGQDTIHDERHEVKRLIAITSLGAVELWKDRIAYNVSKSALQTMAYSLSRSMAPHIAVNSVAPGAIVMPEEPSTSDDAITSASRIPMQRYGTADDVFDAVNYFATCSSYITGQLIMVDGGYHRIR
ncbi:MAG: SDR family oxidoreductase [bacterium]|nr:SDR family oxidoreductase [bacterium]